MSIFNELINGAYPINWKLIVVKVAEEIIVAIPEIFVESPVTIWSVSDDGQGSGLKPTFQIVLMDELAGVYVDWCHAVI